MGRNTVSGPESQETRRSKSQAVGFFDLRTSIFVLTRRLPTFCAKPLQRTRKCLYDRCLKQLRNVLDLAHAPTGASRSGTGACAMKPVRSRKMLLRSGFG
jgi:hypothetical protein